MGSPRRPSTAASRRPPPIAERAAGAAIFATPSDSSPGPATSNGIPRPVPRPSPRPGGPPAAEVPCPCAVDSSPTAIAEAVAAALHSPVPPSVRLLPLLQAPYQMLYSHRLRFRPQAAPLSTVFDREPPPRRERAGISPSVSRARAALGHGIILLLLLQKVQFLLELCELLCNVFSFKFCARIQLACLGGIFAEICKYIYLYMFLLFSRMFKEKLM